MNTSIINWITSIGEKEGEWFGIAVFVFLLLCTAIFLLCMRIKEVKKWKRIVRELLK